MSHYEASHICKIQLSTMKNRLEQMYALYSAICDQAVEPKNEDESRAIYTIRHLSRIGESEAWEAIEQVDKLITRLEKTLPSNPKASQLEGK